MEWGAKLQLKEDGVKGNVIVKEELGYNRFRAE